MTTYKVGYFVGSLSSTSINRILSKALIRVAPDDLEFSEIPIGNLPLYSPDFDNDYPPEARALKASIAAVDAILVILAQTTIGVEPSKRPLDNPTHRFDRERCR